MGKKQFCFFQTAETGNRTPDSGVKGSGANHYPRAPAHFLKGVMSFLTGVNMPKKHFVAMGVVVDHTSPTTPAWGGLSSSLTPIQDGGPQGSDIKGSKEVDPKILQIAGITQGISTFSLTSSVVEKRYYHAFVIWLRAPPYTRTVVALGTILCSACFFLGSETLPSLLLSDKAKSQYVLSCKVSIFCVSTLYDFCGGVF